MLPYLLASDPATSPETLAALVATPGVERNALTAALMHPALPSEASLAAPHQLSAANTHRILNHPGTTGHRRTQILAALCGPTRQSYLARYSDMTPDEIATYVGDPFWLSTEMAHAAARNPHTSTDLADLALRLLAAKGTLPGTSLLVLAAQHNLGLDFMSRLTTLTRADSKQREVMESYLLASSPTYTPVDHTLASGDVAIRRTISETANPDLIYRTAHSHLEQMRDVIDGHCPPDARGDRIRELLGKARPAGDVDTVAITELTGTNALRSMTLLESTALTEASLRPIFEHALRATDERESAWVLTKIAAHPACPPDIRTAALDQIRGTARSKAPFYDEVCTEIICDQLDAVSPHPALDVPVPVIQHLASPRERAESVNQHHVRTAAAAHPAWPLAPDAAVAMLTLEPTFGGTLRQLFDTLTAVTT